MLPKPIGTLAVNARRPYVAEGAERLVYAGSKFMSGCIASVDTKFREDRSKPLRAAIPARERLLDHGGLVFCDLRAEQEARLWLACFHGVKQL